MARRVFIRPRARQDLVDQAVWIAQEDVEAAERFLDAAEAAFARLADHPSIGSPRHLEHPHLEGLRMRPVPGFERFLICYRFRDPDLEVVRILHAARDIFGQLRQERGK